ncbi:DciA family protein [Oceanispirochaeta crateris]|nr:DciA family protein [Oceanispirochaeta crateris]
MDKADQIISNLFNIQGNSESKGYREAYKNWKKIIGDERLSDHCKLEDISNHAIRVSFDHPGWIQVFKMNQSRILKRLNTQYPNFSITSVSMHLNNEKFVQNKAEEKKEIKPPATKNQSFNGDLKSINDNELKMRLESLKKTLQGK